jgi:predicted small lipoprotein YifL
MIHDETGVSVSISTVGKRFSTLAIQIQFKTVNLYFTDIIYHWKLIVRTRTMHHRFLARISLAVIIIISALVTGCGQKGDLYIPHDKSAQSGETAS